MGWQDRQYRPPREEGAFRRAVRRVFETGSFFDLAFPLFTIAGIRVRIHLLFVIYIVVELVRSIDGTLLGPTFTLIRLVTLFTLVLLHEFGHCIACRRVGGEANDVLMWPLGGLAGCHPPHNPTAALITTAGGPAVNLLLMPVFGAALYFCGVPWSMILFNPFHPFAGIGLLAGSSNAVFYAKFFLFAAHVTNFFLFVFNVFLPMFPMDGGRILQELLWYRMGHHRSMQRAVNIGLVMAVLVGIYALTLARNDSTLLFIAVFCGLTCWQERMRLAVMEPEGFPGYDFSRGYKGMPGAVTRPKKTGPTKSEIRARKQAQDLHAEVDRILEKIRTEGMGSLTRKEKAVLQGETERKRRQSREA